MNKEDLEKLSPETLGQLNDALHEEVCKSIITLMKDTFPQWLFWRVDNLCPNMYDIFSTY
jgi:hypothetical protein